MMRTTMSGGARRDRAGFTLMEVMVAVGVLIVATLAAFSSQLTSVRLVNDSRQTDTAIADLRGCMEQVLVLQTDQIPIPTSDFADGQAIAMYTDLHLPDQRITATYPGYAGGAVPNPLPIVLTMTWSDALGRPRTQRLRSMKAR